MLTSNGQCFGCNKAYMNCFQTCPNSPKEEHAPSLIRKAIKTEEQIEEAYNHIKPYLKDQKELPEMCKHCERYCGKKHDYEECRDMMCFKFYLAYVYLDWCNNSDGY